MDPEISKTQIETIFAFLENTRGKQVKIQESISLDRARGYDRHVAVENILLFEVRSINWQVSSGHIYIFGEIAQYGIFTRVLHDVAVQGDVMTIIERIEPNTERRSRIQIDR